MMIDFFNDWEPLLKPLGLLLIAIISVFITNRLFDRAIRKSEDNSSITNYKFLKRIVSFSIFLLGLGLAIYSIKPLQQVAQSLLAGAGILALAVGFASQQALANIVAGIFIVYFKPFRVNDRVTIKDTLAGIVEDITLRHTVIRNFEGRRIIIPNSIISNEILVNADLIEKKVCKWFEIGISYDSNVELAKQIMREEVKKHPLFLDNRSEEQILNGDDPVVVRVIQLSDFSVIIRAWAWVKDNADAFIIGCDLFETVKERFDKQGIEIPFPYRTLVMKEGKT